MALHSDRKLDWDSPVVESIYFKHTLKNEDGLSILQGLLLDGIQLKLDYQLTTQSSTFPDLLFLISGARVDSQPVIGET